MTREQMIYEAVRDYMEYLEYTVLRGVSAKTWGQNILWYPWMAHVHLFAIRFAYWKIKCEQEFLKS